MRFFFLRKKWRFFREKERERERERAGGRVREERREKRRAMLVEGGGRSLVASVLRRLRSEISRSDVRPPFRSPSSCVTPVVVTRPYVFLVPRAELTWDTYSSAWTSFQIKPSVFCSRLSLRYAASASSEVEFHRIADDALDSLQDQFEVLLEDEDVKDSDVKSDSGVLEISLGDSGIYVINKQAPNKQLWLSSPLSGPFRYDFSAEQGTWVYSRDKHTLEEKLSNELSQILDTSVKISI